MPETESRSYTATGMLAVMLVLLWYVFGFDIPEAISTVDKVISALIGQEPSARTHELASVLIWGGLAVWAILALLEVLSRGRISIR